MAMGRAYLAFSEQRPALYAILFSTRRTLVDKEPDVDRDRALDGLVALLQLHQPDARRTTRRASSRSSIWSSLHGYAMLRAVRPHLDWPEPDVYLRRLLERLRAGASAERGACSSSCAAAA